MTTSRRDFLHTALAAGALAGAGVLPMLSRSAAARQAPGKLRILILGGTGFLGPHTVREALRGHTVTLFNRGKSNADLFPELETRIGDRDPNVGDGLTALEEGEWDAVIDNSGYVPRIVGASASLLAPRVGQYVFISSISVYAGFDEPHADETAPLATMDDPTNEEVRVHYGALKALCEQAATKSMDGRATNIRPGLIVGPGDPTDRFTYWPVRIAAGGEVLAPGTPGDPVQVVDVRDLAAFIVDCVEQKRMGEYNAVTKAGELTIGSMLEGCRRGVGSDTKFTWVDADFLEAQGVHGWQHMPAWVSPTTPGYSGFGLVSAERALAAGLQTRPIENTARDTLAWYEGLPEGARGRFGTGRSAGITREREAEVLTAWRERGEQE